MFSLERVYEFCIKKNWKKFWVKNFFFAWKILGAEKFWLEIFFGTKNIYGLTILGPKKNSGLENNFWFEKNLENIFEQNCESKNLICKKKVKKNLGPTEIGVRKVWSKSDQ